MLPKEISSLQHPIVKTLVKLREKKEAREEEKQVLIVGKKLISEMAELGPLELLLLPIGSQAPSHWRVKTTLFASEAIFKKITGLVSPELMAATVALPEESTLKNMRWIVVFDRLNDPGNVGTLLRSALSLGWEGAFFTPDSADPFNEKALRAAKGATFRLPMRRASLDVLFELTQKNGIPLIAADLEGEPLDQLAPLPGALLVLGNEAHGIAPLIKQRSQKVTIPLSGQMESLNVASAGAILLYTLRAHGKR